VNPTLAEVVAVLDRAYDPRRAEGWDAVGTTTGDLSSSVGKVLLAVDAVRATVDEAVAWGADLLLTHHPLLLRGVHSVAATTPKGRLVHDLLRHGVALHTCHTNADVPSGGVSESLALALGLTDLRPLDPAPAAPMDKVTVFVPDAALGDVAAALVDAGAGAIGDYAECRWVSSGTGSFRPLTGANPTTGRIGELEHVPEQRLEMVLHRHLRPGVVAALLSAHPYETPAFDVVELADVPSTDTGSGRIGTIAPTPVAAFARHVAQVLPAHASVVRVAGDPDRMVRSVAVCGGSGDFLLDTARAAGVDVYLTSDLRHHPVSELREHAYDDPTTPVLVDVPHWAAEWTWLPVAARRLAADLSALGATVETRVSEVVTDPWTMHVPSPVTATGSPSAEPDFRRSH
jgi:dinuclear metal center YbgI/SA1388 family protein